MLEVLVEDTVEEVLEDATLVLEVLEEVLEVLEVVVLVEEALEPSTQ